MLYKFKIWWQAIRLHFTFPTFLPVLLGTAIAILETRIFNVWLFFAVLITTIFHHLGLNLADDYYDYQYGTDLKHSPDPYAGGSGVLTAGLLTPQAIKMAAIGCYATVMLFGLGIAYYAGWWVIGLGAFGILCSFYYTAPPLRLAYRGLGEVTIWINFGPVLCLGSYYIQAHKISLAAILLSIIMGSLIFCVIVANEIPDHPTDQATNKRTLIVKYGQYFGLKLLVISIGMILFVLTSAVGVGILPKAALLAWISVPLAYKAVKTLAASLNTSLNTGQNIDPNSNANKHKVHGHEFIIGFSNLFGGILILAISLALIQQGNYLPAGLICGVLLGLYGLTWLATPTLQQPPE